MIAVIAFSCPADPAAVDRAALHRAVIAARAEGAREQRPPHAQEYAKLDRIAAKLPPQVHHLGEQHDDGSEHGSPIREINELRVSGQVKAYVYRLVDGSILVQTEMGHDGFENRLTVLTEPDVQLPDHGEVFPVSDIHGKAITGVSLFMPRFPTAARDCSSRTAS